MAVRSILMFLCFLSVGCTEKVSGVSESSGTSKLYLAVECKNSTKINLNVSEFFPQDAKAVPCEDVRKGRVYFSDDQLQMRFFKKDYSIVQYDCLNPEKHKAFFKKNSGEGIVLVYDGKLLGSFLANGTARDTKCGELMVFSYEEAANMCFALADARGEPIENCTVQCSKSDSKICLDN